MNEALMKKNAAYIAVPICLGILLISCYVYFNISSTQTTLEGKESDKSKSLCVSSYEKGDGRRLSNPQITEDFSSSGSNRSPYGGVVTGKDSNGVPIDVWCLISKDSHGKLSVESVSFSPTL